MTSKEPIAKAPKSRVRRTTLSTRNRIKVRGQDLNYEYRLVNDVDDRVQTFQELGYEIVSKSEGVSLGDGRLGIANSIDSSVRQPVGQGVHGVLMKIPKDYYKEDQEAKEKYLKRQEASMKEEARANDLTYGTLEIKSD